MTKNLLSLCVLLFTLIASAQNEFTAIWNTSNLSTGSSADNQIGIPTNPAFTNYDYTVDWGDGDSDTNVTGDITHTYTTQGTYTIKISGTFPAIFFNNNGDRLKIIEILNWGNIQWQSMENAFFGCANLNFDAISSPNLSQTTSLKNMFKGGLLFNGIINNWDVSTITDISGIFNGARIFNRPLDNWSTGAITDMSEAFSNARLFNEPLDNWNTAAVTNMASMFYYAQEFDQNINNWNVDNVTTMNRMFGSAGSFKRPLNNWRVDNVTDMSEMLRNTPFDQNINNWVVDNVTDMSTMFAYSRFNQPLDNWNVDNVTNMKDMFRSNSAFNQPINNWNVANVTNMDGMFARTSSLNSFDQPLDQWDVSSVTNMSEMFQNSIFNQPINSWDVSSVTEMDEMFEGSFSSKTVFDQPLNNWNVSNVKSFRGMFGSSLFNQPLNTWNLSSATNLSRMFQGAPNFNQPLNNWNIANVTNLSSMFSAAIAFDQNLGPWNIENVTNMGSMLSNSGLSQENYDDTLIAWAAQNVSPNVNLGANGLQYCDGRNARQDLIDSDGWNITGDAVNCSNVFCTTITSPKAGDTQTPANSDIRWSPAPNATGYRITLEVERASVRNYVSIDGNIANNYDLGNTVGLDFTNEFTPGDTVYVTVVPYNAEGPATGCAELSFTVVPSWVNSPAAYKIQIDTRLNGFATTPPNQFQMEDNRFFTYDYSIDWGDGQYNNNVSSDITHTYLTPGIYTVAVIGTFPAPYFGTFGDGEKVISIDQWGTHAYQSMERACNDCENMIYNATDVPNLSQVTDMTEMFKNARLFDGNINNWDVSNVTDMSEAFAEASVFNQPLNNWDVSKVTDMSAMFERAELFNQPLDQWDVSSVTNMYRMFDGFVRNMTFNQNINNWDVSEVTNMALMFRRTGDFNQPLDQWDVSKVTNMSSMFNGTTSFNQDINRWDVGEVTNMSSMFRQASVFDRPLNNWNVSSVTDMTSMFERSTAFNQPIEAWNVANVTLMESMFEFAEAFNQPLDGWNVTNVTNMASMFQNSIVFNQPLASWNVSRVTTMESMFQEAKAFNRPLENWDVNSVVNMSSAFESAEVFDQPLGPWDVSAVANTSSMFKNALLFNQNLNTWDVSSVTLMPSMFEGASAFNGLTSNWDVASVTDMEAMFKDAIRFDRPLNNWDTRKVLTVEDMFNGASVFNRLIDNWDTSSVTTMQSMFEDAIAYNRPMNSWNVASVTTMEEMFMGATAFNGDVGAWNVRGVDTMEEMFRSATAFDQNLNNWRLAGVSNMNSMFEDATTYNQPMDQWDFGNVSMRSTFENATALNQYLGDWNVGDVNTMRDMLDNTALTRENYDNTLIAWSEQTLTSAIDLGAQGLPYCDALEERQSMIDTYGWTISGDMLDCPIPVCTTLTSPMNLDTDVPVNTNLTWVPAQYARGYRLTVGTSAGGNDVVNNETINNETSYEFASDFSTGDTVFVTLIPFNDTGDAVGPCLEERFTISTDPATIPDCTELTAPLAGSGDVSVTTDLSWNPISNADGYRLTVGTAMGASDVVNNEDVGNVNTYEFTADLPEDTDIFVTLIPYNGEGDATTCSEERFKTELIPVPPACTNLTVPSNNAPDVPIDSDLTWAPIAEATGYLVSVGTTSGGVEIVNNADVASGNTFDIPDDLLESRTYHVMIIPYNDVGDASGCLEERFTTGDSTSPPSCVTLSTPANRATKVAPDTDLSWNASGTATGYRLTVGTTSGGTDIFTGDLGDVTTYDLATDLPESTPIHVSITAYNDNGDATSCTEESFTTDGPPACTSLTDPTDGAINVPVDSDIEWDAVTDADGYKLTVAASSSTANNLTEFDLTGTTYNFPNDFERGETVTITVVPYNAIGDAVGPCSSTSFTIIPPPVPLCTALMAPGDGDVDVALRPTLEWIPSTGAEGYKLTVLAGSSTANNETDLDIPTGTTHVFANDFEQGETVNVTLTPYNDQGDATGCTAEIFTIKPIPACTYLTLPRDTDIDVSPDTDLEWTAVPDADGYKVTVSASNSTVNNNTYDVTGNTYDLTGSFEQGETVTVTIVPYNEVGDAIGCSSESFTVKPVPVCTDLTVPTNEAVDVPVDTGIEWTPIAEATGYKVTITASNSTANNVTDLDITLGNTYDCPNDFEQGEEVTVTIVPYNEVGDAIGCTSERFVIESVPPCTNLSAPTDGETVTEVNEIRWDAVADADGYKLNISATNTPSNNETDLIVTGTTHVFPNDFNQGEVVTVTITPFNETGDALGCTSQRFTIRPIPPCTELVDALNRATGVAVTSDISWNTSADADGYRLSVGTSPNGNDLVNDEDVASLTSYIFGEDLPSETVIYVTVVPYNTSGNATGCLSGSFETGVIVPDCSSLINPFNGEEDVALDGSIRWEEIEKTDGYRLSLGTTSGGTDILDNFDVGASTSYRLGEELPFGTEIYVNIIPYNSKGDAVPCEEQSFTTVVPEDGTKYGFSPDGDGINEYWHIDNIDYSPENTVTIFNRWGDAVFQIEGYNNQANVFRGEANLMTKMGAGQLPAGTYFFKIQVPDGHILKKTEGFLVLKR